MVERAVAIESQGALLQGLLSVNEEADDVFVFCHPHPLYGGDMDNPVVRAVVDERRSAGWSTLRFNFRGVGSSTGDFGEGVAERLDVEAAVALAGQWLPSARVVLGGYSFGAAMALSVGLVHPSVSALVLVSAPFGVFPLAPGGPACKPVLLLVGDCDEYCSSSVFEEATTKIGPRARSVVLRGADHFFAARVDDVARSMGALIDAEL